MRIVTAAILMRNGRVFIGQRKAGKQLANLWEFPGGKLEDGESPQACLAREMREEFGIEVVIRESFGENIYRHERGSIRLLAYFIDWTGGEMVLNDHQDCRWVSFDDLEKYDFAPADLPFVQKLRRTYCVLST